MVVKQINTVNRLINTEKGRNMIVEKFDFEEPMELKHTKCFCEKKVEVDELGDWDGDKNEKVIGEDGERFMAYGIDVEGFYISTWHLVTDGSITLRPVHCPLCGRKLRKEMKVEI